jgi:hypothetical protein
VANAATVSAAPPRLDASCCAGLGGAGRHYGSANHSVVRGGRCGRRQDQVQRGHSPPASAPTLRPGARVTPAALWCMRMTTLCLRRLASSGSLEHCLRSGVRLCMPVCSGGRVFELGACCLPNEWIHFDLWSKSGSLQARIAVQTLGLTTLECLRSHQFRQLSHHRRLHVPRGDGVEQPQGL